MGMSYSAAKVAKPEAWEIGKDYFGLTDLFPPSAYVDQSLGCAIFTPPLKDLPHLVGSRHIVGNTPFRVTDFYKSGDEMVARIKELKNDPVFLQSGSEYENLRGFFDWAGDDEVQFIADFDELEERDAADEYQLCAPPNQYVHVNEWNGEAGRPVGYGEEEDDDE